MKKSLSRRDFSRLIGCLGGGLLATPALVEAGVASPAQTEGPFYPVVDQTDKDMDLTLIEGHSAAATGEVIRVRGRVLDTGGKALEGAVVDVWQANHYGRYSHPEDTSPNPLDPNFQGWGIMQTPSSGQFAFKTVLPGPYDISEDAVRCRHIHFKVSHPDRATLTTQMYFEDDPLIPVDTVMKDTPEALRPLLIAKRSVTASGDTLYQWDVVLG